MPFARTFGQTGTLAPFADHRYSLRDLLADLRRIFGFVARPYTFARAAV